MAPRPAKRPRGPAAPGPVPLLDLESEPELESESETPGPAEAGEYMAGVDPTEVPARPLCGVRPNGSGWHGPAPVRAPCGALHFADKPTFRPNLTPKEVLGAGSFGGGYFRAIDSTVTKAHYDRVWEELPADWLEGLDIATQVASPTYRKAVNRYGVACGAKESARTDSFGLQFWESKDWIRAQDPYGWFQWYCRFYQGRRSDDDERQIGRWAALAGPTGRWKQNLIAKCLCGGKHFDDASVSPVVRQTLQHWAYTLTEADFVEGGARVRSRGASYVPRGQLQHVLDPDTPSGPLKWPARRPKAEPCPRA
uniref:Uncharacterized protein n=1 Tax=Eutreptiella gymnastica TaxID=73025 RepID=A0A7S1JA41_9EUGL